MKTINIEKSDRIVTYNPMHVKCVELVHYDNQDTWHVNVVHVIEGREVPETVVCKDHQSAIELHKEYKSCLESI